MTILSTTASASSLILNMPKLREHNPPRDSLLETPSTAEREFLDIARKSPLERLREKILADMKVSEGDLAAMDPEARQAVEDEIKRRMMEALQATAESGSVVDKTA